MAISQVSCSLYTSICGATVCIQARNPSISRLPFSNLARFGSTFVAVVQKVSCQKKLACRAKSPFIRCERSANEGNSLDVWLGRFAMVGFAAAISVEIATGKGLLENFGLTTPLPTMALAVTALVGVLAAIFIFQSASKS